VSTGRVRFPSAKQLPRVPKSGAEYRLVIIEAAR
jgi:hypothetical protein